MPVHLECMLRRQARQNVFRALQGVFARRVAPLNTPSAFLVPSTPFQSRYSASLVQVGRMALFLELPFAWTALAENIGAVLAQVTCLFASTALPVGLATREGWQSAPNAQLDRFNLMRAKHLAATVRW